MAPLCELANGAAAHAWVDSRSDDHVAPLSRCPMNSSNAATSDYLQRDHVVLPMVASSNQRVAASAVSWAAIAAGAAGAAALSLSLLILGVGFGMASISPWSPGSISAAELGVSSIVWLTVTSILASALGGYLAGRLRTRWADAQADEVYFRDTVHGFLTWAIATLATATLLASVVASIVGSGVQAGASIVGATTSAAVTSASNADESSTDYFIDSLFRRDLSNSTSALPEVVQAERTPAEDALEVRRIFIHVLDSAPLPAADLRYLGQLVANRTGLSPPAAEARVNEIYASAQAAVQEVELRTKEAAEKARRATAYGSLWLFIALLGGAFVASWAATFGGRQRDF